MAELEISNTVAFLIQTRTSNPTTTLDLKGLLEETSLWINIVMRKATALWIDLAMRETLAIEIITANLRSLFLMFSKEFLQREIVANTHKKRSFISALIADVNASVQNALFMVNSILC